MQKRTLLLILTLSNISAIYANQNSYDVYNPLGTENSALALDRQNGFIIMSSAALASYLYSEYLLDEENIDFYQIHGGYYYGGSGVHRGQENSDHDMYGILMQSFGVEREYSSWFSMRLEANIQEIYMEDSNYSTAGLGLKYFTKWNLWTEMPFRPFFEYGAGVFYSADKFPDEGSELTFSLSYALGVEYKVDNMRKFRVDYNFYHHSNNNLFDSNPGFDGNGLSLTYSWLW